MMWKVQIKLLAIIDQGFSIEAECINSTSYVMIANIIEFQRTSLYVVIERFYMTCNFDKNEVTH